MSLLEPPQQLLQLLRDSLPDGITGNDETAATGDNAGFEDVLAYVAFLAAGLCDAQEFTPSVWAEALQPYLENLVKSAEEPVEKFRVEAEKVTVGADDNDSYGDADDDQYEEICNLRFKYVRQKNVGFDGHIHHINYVTNCVCVFAFTSNVLIL